LIARGLATFSEPPVKPLLLALIAACLVPLNLVAWTNGELLIWMDSARRQGLNQIARKFEHEVGIRVSIKTPQNITTSFPIAAQAGKGPDIVIWAHHKVGEWADSGLIAPVEAPQGFVQQFFSRACEAVLHRDQFWAHPIALEAVTLLYNKELLDGPPPAQLSQLISLDRKLQREHPGVSTILWDYDSA
jgi:maltose/maltodextrin transport system substrate-binding protein